MEININIINIFKTYKISFRNFKVLEILIQMDWIISKMLEMVYEFLKILIGF